MTRTDQSIAALAALAVVFVTVDAFQTIDERHAARRVYEETHGFTVPAPFPTDEDLARAHQPEAVEFPDPCGLDAVVCPGEPGWEEE
jgi:hypothetical protein